MDFGYTRVRPAQRLILLALALAFVGGFGALSAITGVAARPSPTASPTPTVTPASTAKPKSSGGSGGSTKSSPTTSPAPSLPSPGTLPAGSTRTNPLPSSPTAPALITVDPSSIDPGVENALNIFARNVSADTRVQIDNVPAVVLDSPDAWHIIVSVPSKRLADGRRDVVLTNPDGQFDDAMGALTVLTPPSNNLLYLLIGGLVAVGFGLFRFYRWLVR